ncbi:acyl-CoA thioesterase [Penaeicola halotolerans]|uniref:acyl-CoA thioesterase n=1 Tax=Penaeicola halotolerans TaxID=2793196 RepID=UPI001CF88DCF|nr:acyl-CoA thioesterase [Penaeicola halotolerans]
MSKSSIDPLLVKETYRFNLPIQVKYSDLDAYMHVNNAVYLNYLEHARALYLREVCDWDINTTGAVLGNVNINFIKAIHVGDHPTAYVKCIRLGQKSFTLDHILMEERDGKQIIYAQCQATLVSVDMESMKSTPIPEVYRSKMITFDGVK